MWGSEGLALPREVLPSGTPRNRSGFSQRILELKDDFLPDQIGYILWGYAKSGYANEPFYSDFLPVAKRSIPEPAYAASSLSNISDFLVAISSIKSSTCGDEVLAALHDQLN